MKKKFLIILSVLALLVSLGLLLVPAPMVIAGSGTWAISNCTGSGMYDLEKDPVVYMGGVNFNWDFSGPISGTFFCYAEIVENTTSFSIAGLGLLDGDLALLQGQGQYTDFDINYYTGTVTADIDSANVVTTIVTEDPPTSLAFTYQGAISITAIDDPINPYHWEVTSGSGSGTYAEVSNETGGGCFIATAAYGTPMADEIDVLRDFRDEYLLTNPVGEGLVNLYYHTSPPVADFIAEHPTLKQVVRSGLTPVVALSSVAVNTSTAQKIALCMVVLVSTLLIIWLRRKLIHS